MMNYRRLLAIFFVAFMFLACNTAFCINTFAAGEEYETSVPSQEEYSGLVTVDGKLYYFDPETHEKFVPEKEGTYLCTDKYYYFNADSSVLTVEQAGAYKINESYYLFDKDSSVLHVGEETSFVDLDGSVYLADEYGQLKTGLVLFSTKSYYFDFTTAKMHKGLKEISGSYYYFDTETGEMRNGIVKDSLGKTRYFSVKTGKMLTGLIKYENEYYYFDTETGLMKTGLVKDSKGRTRYFSVKSGKMLTGLVKYDGSYYYFDTKTGLMKTGLVEDRKGKTRYFSLKTGKMLTGLVKYDGSYYYFDTKTGVMRHGLVKDSKGRTRYFSVKSGKMLTGLVKYKGNYYYFNTSNGIMKTGWLKLNGSYYYFSPNSGKMLKSTIVGNYYVLSNGKRATSKAVNYAVSVVNQVTTSSMTQEEKLRACYNWIIRNCSYARDYTDPAKLNYNWTRSYAEYLFANKKGNCYKYASAMGYCAAVLGYSSKVAYGKISSSHGMTNHGWTEVAMNGKTYLFDTVQADYYSNMNFYKRTYSNYPKKLQKNASRPIVLS